MGLGLPVKHEKGETVIMAGSARPHLTFPDRRPVRPGPGWERLGGSGPGKVIDNKRPKKIVILKLVPFYLRRKRMAEPLQVSDAEFEQEILKSDIPALVDFWAAWCGPCRAIGPVVEELARDYAGKVKVAKMNVDENAKTPAKYGIRAIPTLIIFKGGQVVEQITGAVSRSIIENALKKAL
jgi:thioredoxin 1